MVKTICYGIEEIWETREEAMQEFLFAMIGSEGFENDRYTKIYCELAEGFDVATDEDSDDYGEMWL